MACQWRRCLLLAAAFIGTAMTGHAVSSVVFAHALRRTFNISQLQYEVIMSMQLVGLSLQMIPGIIFDHFGVRVTLSIGLIGTLCSYLLLLIAVYLPHLFQGNVGYLATAHFLLTHSVCYSSIPAIGVCMASFPLRHKGKVMILLDSGYQGAIGLFLIIYLTGFRNGHVYDEENQNIIGYFWFCTVFCALGFSFSLLILKKIPWTESEENEPTMSPESEASTKNTSIKMEFKDCCCRIVSQIDFQLLLWICVTFGGAMISGVSNTVVVSRSMKLSEYDTLILTLPTLVSILLRLIILPISDEYGKPPHIRSALMCSTQIIGVISVIILLAPMRWGSELATVFSSRILLQFPLVGMYCMLPILISALYDERHFGKLFGLVLFGFHFAAVPLNLQFGALYESVAQSQHHKNTTAENRYFCFGDSCYRSGFITIILAMLIGLLLCVVLTVKLWKTNSRNTTEYITIDSVDSREDNIDKMK